MKSKAGFTKKDVVVILGCVGFLLANIGAIGSGGRRRAKEAVCLSNLRQWGTIFQTYTNDHDGYFMGGWTTAGFPDGPSEAWLHALRAYYGNNRNLCCCPEANKPLHESGGGGGSTFRAWGVFSETIWYGEGDYGSYGISTTVYDVPTRPGLIPATDYWRRTDVAGADNIPVFLDALWIDGWVWHGQDPPEYDGQPWPLVSSMGFYCINRHNGFINGLFMDWSARKIGLKELWTLKWSRNFDVNGPWTIAGGVTYDDWANHGTGWMKDFKDY